MEATMSKKSQAPHVGDAISLYKNGKAKVTSIFDDNVAGVISGMLTYSTVEYVSIETFLIVHHLLEEE